MLRTAFFLLVLTMQPWAWCHVLTVTSGYSSIESDSTGNTTAIYAGLAGSPCNGDGISTCNTCTESSGGAVHACSLAAIYPALKITINLKFESAVNAGTKWGVYVDGDGTSGVQTLSETTLSKAYAAGESISYTLTWENFCSNYGSTVNSSCVGYSSALSSGSLFLQKNIYIGIDSDGNSMISDSERKGASVKYHYIEPNTIASTNWCPDQTAAASSTGICQTKVAAGDQKIYVQEWTFGGASYQGPPIDSMAVFAIVPTTTESDVYTDFANGKVAPSLLEIDSTNQQLKKDQVKGLQNDTKYCFVVGAINKAKNLYSVANGGTILTSDVCTTPSEVVGLLEDKHCFISTAAFGSPLAKEVEVFRQFRNEYLLNNKLGVDFVKAYYKYSPPLADVIVQHEGLRILSRIILYPVLIFSYLSLKLGLVITGLIFFGLTGLLLNIKRLAR